MARLLIVDDETGLLTAMRQYFRGRGYEVDCAETEAQATALIAQRCYDCVICDLNLTAARCGEGDTIIAEAVRRCPDTRSILITAYEPPDGTRHADCCLQKPQRLQALEATVRRLLESGG